MDDLIVSFLSHRVFVMIWQLPPAERYDLFELIPYIRCVCTEPNAPTKLQMTAATVDSLKVSWTASTTGSVTYTVTLNEKDITTGKETKTNVSGTAATFAGLTAGKEYTVAVVSVAGVVSSGGQNSDPLADNFFTSKSVLD